MAEPDRMAECRREIEPEEGLAQEIPEIVQALVASCQTEGCFDHVSPVPIPSRQAVVQIIEAARRVLFPGYFTETRIDSIGLTFHLGQEVSTLFDLLSARRTGCRAVLFS